MLLIMYYDLYVSLIMIFFTRQVKLSLFSFFINLTDWLYIFRANVYGHAKNVDLIY